MTSYGCLAPRRCSCTSRDVAAAIEVGVEITTVPGPVAAIAALVSSGLPSGRFVFEGFLARKGQERTAQLSAIATESRTTVFYESANRVAATLAALRAGAAAAE